MRSARFFLLLGAALALAAPALAECPGDMREFMGSVTSISGAKLRAGNRMGDDVSFTRTADTRVEGRAGWDAIKVGDAVSVCWRFEDRPRKARSITLR